MDRFRSWFAAHGGSFDSRVMLDVQGPFGVAVLAPQWHTDTTVVTCPFALIITTDTASQALTALLGPDVDAWSDRQRIASYLCFHHVCPSEVLRHLPYVQCLPQNLSTSLYFTTAERALLRGTNLYGATLDRERDWQAEWVQCRTLVQSINPTWADAFTWERYKAASTHLSSRAFPSTLLAPTPSLVATPSTSPVLIPGVDLLNHKRGQAVSWIVSCQDTSTDTIAIVAHPDPDPIPSTDARIEVFNNYGPKPNDEFILGYGFVIPDNPDDTITLQIGGASAPSPKWVVGRHARNADGLWSDVRGRLADGQRTHAFEDDLDAAAVLSDMVRAKLDGIKTVADVRASDSIRPSVGFMLEHYIAGQRDILESILEFAHEKQEAAIESAREQGIDLVFDDDD